MTFGARAYHDEVSYGRDAMSPHRLDWAHSPAQTKSYPGVTSVPLPRVSLPADPPGSRVLMGEEAFRSLSTLEDLARALLLACAPTAMSRGGEHVFRSIPSAGALYPTEIYAAASAVQGLEDGVYHYSPLEYRLHRLRPHNPFPASPEATVHFFFSAVYFRSAWKYRARSYRYHLLDTGHAVEAMALALNALGCPWVLRLNFDDEAMNRLLGLDPEREVALAWMPSALEHASQPLPRLTPLADTVLRASRMSEREVEYAEVRKIHQNGRTPVTSKEDRGPASMVRELRTEPGDWKPVASTPPWPSDSPYTTVVAERRSSRNFTGEPVSTGAFDALTASLCAAGNEPDSRERRPPWAAVGIGLLVRRVEGTPPGFYLLDPDTERIGLVRDGRFIAPMSRICLDQAWLAGAAIHVLFLADLDVIDRAWGARGYRYAMLAAGRLGHRVYLASTALDLGCCGIGAFYDHEAKELLGLVGASRLLYLVAVGSVRGGFRRRTPRDR